VPGDLVGEGDIAVPGVAGLWDGHRLIVDGRLLRPQLQELDGCTLGDRCEGRASTRPKINLLWVLGRSQRSAELRGSLRGTSFHEPLGEDVGTCLELDRPVRDSTTLIRRDRNILMLLPILETALCVPGPSRAAYAVHRIRARRQRRRPTARPSAATRIA